MSLKDYDGWESHKLYYLLTLNIKDYKVMIDAGNFFDHPIRNDLNTYDNIRKIATGQGVDYTTGCLIDYSYFSKILQLNWNRFKQTTKIRFWSKINTIN